MARGSVREAEAREELTLARYRLQAPPWLRPELASVGRLLAFLSPRSPARRTLALRFGAWMVIHVVLMAMMVARGAGCVGVR